MGASNETLTNIKSQQSFEKQYKLIRRFTCDCYGQLTIIKNKQTQQLSALKYFVCEQESIISRIKRRSSFKHPNLISLKYYWLQQETLSAVSICSNLNKVGVMYEYYQKSLQDELLQQIKLKNQIKKAKKHNRYKSIFLNKNQSQSQTVDQMKFRQSGHSQHYTNQKLQSRKSQSTDPACKLFSDAQLTQLIWQLVGCLNYLQEKGVKYIINGLKSIKFSNTRNVKLLQSEYSISYDQKNVMSQLIHCITSKRQIPLHPSFQNQGNGIYTNQTFVTQNIFAIGIIALSFALLKLPCELGVFSNGVYNFEKLTLKTDQISQKYPKTYFHLKQMLTKKFPKQMKYENFIGNFHLVSLKQNNQNYFSIKEFKLPVTPLPLRQKTQKSQSQINLNTLKMRNYFKCEE